MTRYTPPKHAAGWLMALAVIALLALPWTHETARAWLPAPEKYGDSVRDDDGTPFEEPEGNPVPDELSRPGDGTSVGSLPTPPEESPAVKQPRPDFRRGAFLNSFRLLWMRFSYLLRF